MCVNGPDGVEPGRAALGVLVDRADRGGGVRGRVEHREFHGWDQWHHGVLQPRGAGAAGAAECAGWLHGGVVPGGGNSGRAGVLLAQLPSEGQSEVLRGGCR